MAKDEPTYRKLLRGHLLRMQWDVLRESDEADWWADRFWWIGSRRECPGLEVVLVFLVDPQYEGRDKQSAVWAVSAVEKVPSSRSEAESGIDKAVLSKGKLDENLESFMEALNAYRQKRQEEG